MDSFLCFHIDRAVQDALQEDLPAGDITTELLFPNDWTAEASIVAKTACVVAGLQVARAVFTRLDNSVSFLAHHPDGASVKEGTRVATVTGRVKPLLMAERTALNFLQRLSGIATLTAQCRQAVRGYPVAILDTRKTTPGLRILEKWAVSLGGGVNHRCSLSDGILIKDTHLAFLTARGQTLRQICQLAKEKAPHRFRVEVEVETLEQVQQALEAGVESILLDNMSPAVVREAVQLVKGRAYVEVSGGITLANIREMAQAGVNAISVGALTHSAPFIDFAMEGTPLSLNERLAGETQTL
ncbi:MAG: carboxylating nicotinate-nucleotide diphosphorylase [Nitrospirae bacterium]|nr:MAG: carboxylating nicotinate-nucleotide diphosphorylase [Nitrospirota bacterium]